LHTETIVLDLEEAINDAPNLTEFSCRLIDNNSLEVDIDKDQTINDLFAVLATTDLRVSSMRNKSNRLEELFVNLVKKTAA
jgi:ABC-2 type transport system ATP-binding protein